MILCIDPNLRGCGVAFFNKELYGPVLVDARYIENTSKIGRGYAVAAELGELVYRFAKPRRDIIEQVLVEQPRIYPGMPDKDLNDLLDVMAVGASVASLVSCASNIEVVPVTPSAWKGSMKKAAMLERIKSKLTSEEESRVQWSNKSNNEDILDAIGIGLWHFNRLNTKVYPGATR